MQTSNTNPKTQRNKLVLSFKLPIHIQTHQIPLFNFRYLPFYHSQQISPAQYLQPLSEPPVSLNWIQGSLPVLCSCVLLVDIGLVWQPPGTLYMVLIWDVYMGFGVRSSFLCEPYGNGWSILLAIPNLVLIPIGITELKFSLCERRDVLYLWFKLRLSLSTWLVTPSHHTECADKSPNTSQPCTV